MYAFAFLSMPLSFLALAALRFRSGTGSYPSYVKGLLGGIPAVLLWLLFTPLFAPVWGSWLLVLTFLFKYWVLPFGLAVTACAVLVGFRGLSRGGDYEKVTACMFGVLTVFGVAHTIEAWGDPSRVYALVLPCLLVGSALAFPVLLEEAAKDGFPVAMKQILLALGAFSIAAFGAALFFMRFAWLGLIISLLLVAGAGFMGWRRLGQLERLVSPEQPVMQPRQGRRTLPLKKHV
jgi:hypothetical protein